MQSRSLGFLHLAAMASAGAALVHAAAAGSHGDHNSVQLLFAVCAVLQLGWAALVLVTPRPLAVAAGIVLNAGAVVCWAVQRTVGLPLVDALRDPEDVGVQDSLAATLGTLAAVLAVASLVPRVGRRRLPNVVGLAGAAAALLFALPAMAVDHDSGGGHSHDDTEAAGGHEHEAEPASVADEDRCDVGFNTAEFNGTTVLVAELGDGHGPHMGAHDDVDYTIDEWAEVFADQSLGVTPEGLAAVVRSFPPFNDAVTNGAFTPTLEPDPWVPMTDPDDCDALATELRRARQAAARYPTVADAVAAGFVQQSPVSAGQGAHYTNMSWLGVDVDQVNLDQPAQLMFAGSAPDAPLVGMAYLAIMPNGGTPDAFTGPNDRFHLHTTSCLGEDGIVKIADGTAEDCAAVGGNFTDVPGEGLFMLHTWVVPGCESDWGLFSNANPKVPWMPPGAPFAAGCNSGATVSDPLAFDDSADGAVIG